MPRILWFMLAGMFMVLTVGCMNPGTPAAPIVVPSRTPTIAATATSAPVEIASAKIDSTTTAKAYLRNGSAASTLQSWKHTVVSVKPEYEETLFRGPNGSMMLWSSEIQTVVEVRLFEIAVEPAGAQVVMKQPVIPFGSDLIIQLIQAGKVVKETRHVFLLLPDNQISHYQMEVAIKVTL